MRAGEIYQNENRRDVASSVSVEESFDQLLDRAAAAASVNSAAPAAATALEPDELIALTRDPDRVAAVKSLKSKLDGRPEFAAAFAALDRGGPLEFLLTVQETAYQKKSEGAALRK